MVSRTRLVARWFSTLFALALFSAAQSAIAFTCTYSQYSGASPPVPANSWDDARNWINCNASTPQLGNAVIISGGSTVKMAAGSYTIGSLRLDGALEGNGLASTTLTITANDDNLDGGTGTTFKNLKVDFSPGAFNYTYANGPFTLDGAMFIHSRAEIYLFNSINLVAGSIFQNMAGINTGYGISIAIGAGSEFNNGDSSANGYYASFGVNSGGLAIGGSGTFNNSGVLSITDGNVTIAPLTSFNMARSESQIFGDGASGGTITTSNTNLTLAQGAIGGKMTFNLGTGTLTSNGMNINTYVGAASNMTVNGNFVQNNGTLSLTFYTAANFDQVAVSGNVALTNVDIIVNHDVNYWAPNGTTHSVITAGSFKTLTKSGGSFQFPSEFSYTGSIQLEPTPRYVLTQTAAPSRCDARAAGSWTDADNWGGACTRSRIPNAGDETIVKYSLAMPSGDFEVATLQMDEGGNITGNGLGNTTLRIVGGYSEWAGEGYRNFTDMTLTFEGYAEVSASDVALTNAKLKIKSDASFYPNKVSLTGPTTTLENEGSFELYDNLTATSGAVFKNLSGGYIVSYDAITIDGLFENKGTLRQNGGGPITLTDATKFSQTDPSAELYVAGTMTGTGTLTLANGRVQGASTSWTLGFPTVANTGATIYPSSTGEVGALTVSGNYQQGSGGKLSFLFCDVDTYDQLLIGGTPNTLAGTAEIVTSCGQPSIEDEISAIVALSGTISGAFANIVPPSGRSVTAQYVPGSVKFKFGAAPRATLSPEYIDFGPQSVGIAAPPQTLTITNTAVGSIQFANNFALLDVANPSPFSIGPGTCQGATISNGQSCTISIGFLPTTASNFQYDLLPFLNMAELSGSLFVDSEDIEFSSVQLSGSGVNSPVSISPSSRNFASVAIGATAQQTFVVTNNTGSAVAALAATVLLSGPDPEQFEVYSNTCSGAIAIGATCAVAVRFRPDQLPLGLKLSSLEVTLNGNTATAALSGTSTAATGGFLSFDSATPLSVPGPVTVGSTIGTCYTLTNIGSAAVNISSFSATGPFANEPGCFCPSPIAAGASCSAGVRVTPTAAGPLTGTLTILSDAVNSTLTRSLTSSGTNSQVPTVTTTVSTPTMLVGQTRRATITITNPNATGLSGVSVGSFLSAGVLSVAPTPNFNSSGCGGIAFTPNTGYIYITGATVAPGGTCTFGYDFVGNTAGSWSVGSNSVSSNEVYSSFNGGFTSIQVLTASGPFAYIPNFGSGSLSVIDLPTSAVSSTIALGTNPFGVALNSAGTKVYVTNLGGGAVSVIDTATNTSVAAVTVGNVPAGVAVNPAGTKVYVANNGVSSSGTTVSVINATNNTVASTVTVGTGPIGVAVNSAGTRVYVANETSNNVSVIDAATDAVVGTIPVGLKPYGATFNPTGSRAYVTNGQGNSVSVIDVVTSTVIATISVGSSPTGVAVSPDGARAYVVNSGANTVSVINTQTNTVIATPSVGAAPHSVSLNSSGTAFYVTSKTGNSVGAYDTTTNGLIGQIAVGTSPYSVGTFILPSGAVTAPSISSATPAGGTIGAAYTHTFTANGTAPFDWSLSSGSLPAGLTLNRFSGVLSGTPTEAGTFNFTVQAANGTGAPATQAVSLILAKVTPTISQTGSPSTAVPGQSFNIAITVASASPLGTPTGTVTVKLRDVWTNTRTDISGGTCLNAALVAGAFTCPYVAPAPAVAGYEVEVTYNGDGANNSATTVFPLTTTRVNPTVTQVGSPSTAVPGQSFNIAITVASASPLGTPTGTVTVKLRDVWTNTRTDISGGTCLNAALVAGAFTCTYVAPAPAVAGYEVEVTYNGDGANNSATAAFPLTTTRVNPTVTQVGSPSTAVPGQAFNIAITVASASPLGTPTGTVTVKLRDVWTNTRTDISGGTCLNAPLVAGAFTCPYVAPAPAVAGYEVEITYNGDGANSSATLVVPLTTAVPTTTFAPASLAHGDTVIGQPNVIANNVFTNTSSFAITLASSNALTSSSGIFLVAAGSIGTPCANNLTIIAGSSCTFNSTYTPPGVAAHSGTYTFTYSVGGANFTSVLNVAGSGIAASAFAPASVAFGNVPITVGATQTVTFSNPSGVPVRIISIAHSDARYTSAGNGGSPCSPGVDVSAGGSCTYALTFTPAGTGSYNNTTTVTYQPNATGPTFTAMQNASGNGITLPSTLSPPSVAFGNTTLGTTSTQVVTFTNTSNGTSFPSTYTISSLSSSGLGFSALGSGGSPCNPSATVAPGASCTFTETFLVNSGSIGSYNGTTTLNFLTGQGANPTYTQTFTANAVIVTSTPGLSLSVGSLTFATPQLVGSSSGTQAVTLTNTGNTTINLTLPFIASGDFSVTSNCTATLAPAATCAAFVTFSPTFSGPRTGQMTVTSTAPSSPNTVLLSGTATAAPVITSGAPPAGTVGVPYTYTGTATGYPTVTWSISTGALPSGLSLNSTTGVLTGTPTTAGTFNFTVQAANGTLPNATQNTSITIAAATGPFAYVASQTNSTLAVIDVLTNATVSSIPVGNQPFGVATNAAGTLVYVTNRLSNSVSVVDTSTNTVTATVNVGTEPHGVAVNQAGTRVYVANYAAAAGTTVSVIDTSNNTVTNTITVGTGPLGIAVSPSGARVYVTNSASGNVSVIDTTTNAVIATISVSTSPYAVALNPAGTRAYVSNYDAFTGTTVSVIDTTSNTVIAPVTVGAGPTGVAVKPDGTAVYVANYGSASVSVIDTATNTVTTTVPVGTAPIGVSLNAAGTRAYIANYNAGSGTTVSVIDTATNSTLASLTSGPGSISLGQMVIPATASLTAPTITSAAPASGMVGVAYTHNFVATGTAPLGWSVASGALPIGLTLNPLTGVLSGTPTSSGSSSFTVQASNGFGSAATQIVSFTVNAAPTIAYVGGTSVAPGGTLDLVFKLANSAPPVVAGASVAVTYPAGFTNQPQGAFPQAGCSSTLGGYTNGGNSSSVTGGFLGGVTPPSTTNCNLLWTKVTAPATPGTYTFTLPPGSVTFSSPFAYSNPSPITFNVAVTSLSAPTLSFAASPTSFASGGTSIATLTVSNPNATPLTANPFTFSYAPGIVNAASPNASSTCVGVTPVATPGAGSSATSTGFTIPASGSCSFSVTLTSSTPAVYSGNISAALIVTNGGSTNATPFSLTVTAAPAPVYSASVAALTFASRAVASTSAGQTITITNTGTANLTWTGPFTLAGGNAGDFARTGTCTPSNPILPTAQCTIVVTFTPGAAGARSATLTLTSNASGSPHVISLSGTGASSGTPPVITSNSALPSGMTGQQYGHTFVATGTGPITWSVFSGSLPPGLTLSTGGSLSGVPTQPGTFSFVARATNSAGTASQGVAILVAAPLVAFISASPSSLTFGNQATLTTSPSQTVTITSTGNGPAQIQAIVGSGDFSFNSGCPLAPATLAPGATCTISVAFAPLIPGPLTGGIGVTTTTGNSASISLAGNGVNVPRPSIAITPGSLIFGDQAVGSTSAQQSFTISNSGQADLQLRGLDLSGSGFSTSSDGISNGCGGIVKPGASCRIGIVFAPTVTGPANAAFNITHNATPTGESTTVGVGLTGNGTPKREPVIRVSGNLFFNEQVIGTVSPIQTVSVSNAGTANLAISGISVNPVNANTNSGDFSVGGNCGTLTPGASCTLTVTFTPSAPIGAKGAILNIGSNASNAVPAGGGTVGVGLSGTAAPVPQPVVKLSSTTIGFGTSLLGSLVPSQVVTLTNAGSRVLTNIGIGLVGEYIQSNNCGATLNPNQSCSINILFVPQRPGLRPGSLSITSNAPSNPDQVILSGTGCIFSSNPAAGRLFVRGC